MMSGLPTMPTSAVDLDKAPAWAIGSTQQLITTKLGRINVRVGGNSAGQAMVFWPSLLMTGAMWRYQYEHYSSDHQVVLIDPPGIGKSDALRRKITLEECADCLVEILDSLDIKSCIFIGCSWGALLGSVFAAWHPERLVAAVLSNGTADAPSVSETIQMTVLITMIGVNRKAPNWLVSATRSAFAGKTAIAKKPDFINSLDFVLAEDPKSISMAMKSVLLRRQDHIALLGNIKNIPVLVIAGEEDGQFTVPTSRRFSDAIPGSQFTLLPETGHLAPFESPTLANSAIDAFLERLQS